MTSERYPIAEPLPNGGVRLYRSIDALRAEIITLRPVDLEAITNAIADCPESVGIQRLEFKQDNGAR